MYTQNSHVIEDHDISLSSLKNLVFSGKISLEDAVQHFEKSMINEALELNHNNLTHSAKMLGISRRMIKYKIDQYLKPTMF